MTDHQATPEQWYELERCSHGSQPWAPCILELRARVEALEDAACKHIVETSSNILALASRVDALEAAKRPASKVYEINEPLQLTPEQAQQVRDLLAPNTKPTPNPRQIRSSLVERVLVSDWIATRGCAKSSAYKWLGILGIRPRREVNRATGKVESWLTSSEASILTAYADALELGHRSTEASIKAWDSINAKLVYRVNDACLKVDAFDDPLEWSRAAIREVAAWMRSNPDHHFPPALVFALEHEAEI